MEVVLAVVTLLRYLYFALASILLLQINTNSPPTAYMMTASYAVMRPILQCSIERLRFR